MLALNNLVAMICQKASESFS